MDGKNSLIEFLLAEKILVFADYTTNSGRISPYYFNLGSLDTATKLQTMAKFYSACVLENFPCRNKYIFGPAYKGISLAIASAQEIKSSIGLDVHFSFNRKEKKDHGEGGDLVGYQYTGGENVIVVEDVITSGKSLEQSFEILNSYRVNVLGAVVAVDRQEKFSKNISAKDEIVRKFDIPVFSLLTLSDILRFLQKTEQNDLVYRMKNYMDLFCVG
jgi:orotate phosphoribosyltransferase